MERRNDPRELIRIAAVQAAQSKEVKMARKFSNGDLVLPKDNAPEWVRSAFKQAGTVGKITNYENNWNNEGYVISIMIAGSALPSASIRGVSSRHIESAGAIPTFIDALQEEQNTLQAALVSCERKIALAKRNPNMVFTPEFLESYESVCRYVEDDETAIRLCSELSGSSPVVIPDEEPEMDLSEVEDSAGFADA